MLSLTRFALQYETPVQLGTWGANRLRGALGHSLRRLVCTSGMRTCDGCATSATCPYAYCFETEAAFNGRFHAAGQEIPRPYVLRLSPTAQADASRGLLAFELVLAGAAESMLPLFVMAVNDWQEPGTAPGYGVARLQVAMSIHPFNGAQHTVFSATNGVLRQPRWQLTAAELAACMGDASADSVTVRFLTPTRLKYRGRQLSTPVFAPLIASLVRRLESLHRYHDLPVLVERPEELIHRASEVVLKSWQGRDEERERYSFRQNRRMRVEGFVGQAVYSGELAPFLPLLKLGELLHVGKGAVMGLGRIRVEALDGLVKQHG